MGTTQPTMPLLARMDLAKECATESASGLFSTVDYGCVLSSADRGRAAH